MDTLISLIMLMVSQWMHKINKLYTLNTILNGPFYLNNPRKKKEQGNYSYFFFVTIAIFECLITLHNNHV